MHCSVKIRPANFVQLMNETLDGDYQTYKSKDGAYVRENFFERYPETAALVKDMTDDEIFALTRGGHDPRKMFAALQHAKNTSGKPTVILAKTVKGYGMGEAAEGKNIAHQVKKMNMDSVRHLRDRFSLPVADAILKLPYLNLKLAHQSMIICMRSAKNLKVTCQHVCLKQPWNW